MRELNQNHQKGFSAVSLFIYGVVILIVMGAAGFFTFEKSSIEDKNSYEASGSRNPDNDKGLIMTDILFTTPTSPPPTIVPTISIPPYIPPPAGGCEPYTEIKDCPCAVPPYAVWTYCGGKKPPQNPDCPSGLSSCPQSSGDPTCVEYCMGKPVIYLYPVEPTFVTVNLTIPGSIIESIPQVETVTSSKNKFTGGWTDVLAMPGGILKYKDNYYRELYYESSVDFVRPPTHGLFIKRQSLREDLFRQVIKLGLTELEGNEFVDYWEPKLAGLEKDYIFFSFLDSDEKERTDNVQIVPKPNTFIKFIAYFKGTDEPYTIESMRYPNVPQRLGFTAVEWGGVIDR